jgi:hypothetical protein
MSNSEECPRCTEEGVVIFIEDPEGSAFRTVVPWSLIEDAISDHVRDALDTMIEEKDKEMDSNE